MKCSACGYQVEDPLSEQFKDVRLKVRLPDDDDGMYDEFGREVEADCYLDGDFEFLVACPKCGTIKIR